MSRALFVLGCLAAAPAASALSPRRCIAPALRGAGTPHAQQHAAALSTVTALRGGGVSLTLDLEKLLSYGVHAVAGIAALGSVVVLTSVLALLFFVTKPSLSETGLRSRRWSELREKLSYTGAYDTVADGAAGEHAAPARREAAKKLVMNHERVLHDLTRVDGAPKTQPDLFRMPGQEHDVDTALREVARRLVGRLPRDSARRGKPATVEQARAWAATAEFLSARVQATAEEMEGVEGHEQRKPDMSPEAAAAFKAVLAEVAKEEVPSLFKRAIKPLDSSADAVRPAVQVGP